MSNSIDTIISGLINARKKLDDLTKRGVFFGKELSVLSQDPGIAEMWKQLAIAGQVVEDEFEKVPLEEIEDFINIAIALGPCDIESRSVKGSFLFGVNDETDKGLQLFQEAHDLCIKQLAESTAGLSECLIEVGRKGEAEALIKVTLLVCPESEELLALLEEIQSQEKKGRIADSLPPQ